MIKEYQNYIGIHTRYKYYNKVTMITKIVTGYITPDFFLYGRNSTLSQTKAFVRPDSTVRCLFVNSAGLHVET